MTKTESSVTVYFSNEYGGFKFLKGNRDINEVIVNRILHSIKEEGVDLLKYSPIIVDQDMHILDGQHRFTVSKMLKRPVFFIIASEMSVREIAKINSNSSNWKIKDYMNSYLDLKLDAYQAIKELYDIYPMNVVMIASFLMSGHSRRNNIKQLFIDGLVEVHHYDKTVEVMEMLQDFAPFTIRPFSQRFVHAIENLRHSELYDHELMLSKLRQSGLQIDRIDSAKSIIAQMEEIINYRMKQRIRII